MEEKKSSCLIRSINLNSLGKNRKKFALNSSLVKKVYNIDELYGVFYDDCTFQFVRESSFAFDEWEEVQNKSPYTYYELVHKRQFQLSQLESGAYLTEPFVENIPWHNGEVVDMNGHFVIPIEAKNFIPKNFISQNRVTDSDLDHFSNFISRILTTNPSLLESYFPKTEIQKAI